MTSRLIQAPAPCADDAGPGALALHTLAPVVVVAPHPDDETLGCGGLIAACAQAGIAVSIVAVTSGEASHPHSRQWPPERLARQRRKEQMSALRVLGLRDPQVCRLDLPDGAVNDRFARQPSAARKRLSLLLDAANSVFVSASDDDHPDHRASARIVAELVGERRSPQVFEYAIWPDTDRAARSNVGRGDHSHGSEHWRLDVSGVIERKAAALREFDSQRGELIDDDPSGFRLPNNTLSTALAEHELFRRTPGAGTSHPRQTRPPTTPATQGLN